MAHSRKKSKILWSHEEQGFVRYHKTPNVTKHNTTFLSLRRRIPYNDTIVVYNWCYNSQKLVKHKGKSG
jgi:hypothetical protein